MEWLTQVQITPPSSATKEEIAAMAAAENARATELAEAGHVLRVWRVPGRWANFGLWSAVDATELHELLSSLPLFPWMTITVHPLARHPIDPGPPVS
jgi:muconolactone D-isomerase